MAGNDQRGLRQPFTGLEPNPTCHMFERNCPVDFLPELNR
jgi:hypothetical protein